jgi:hypothetical protein
MNNINTTTKLWVATTRNGNILCYGNPNEHLSYHVANMQFVLISDRMVWGTRRWEIMLHIKKWNKQCGNRKDWKCKAVKVAITIEEIKKGKRK